MWAIQSLVVFDKFAYSCMCTVNNFSLRSFILSSNWDCSLSYIKIIKILYINFSCVTPKCCYILLNKVHYHESIKVKVQRNDSTCISLRSYLTRAFPPNNVRKNWYLSFNSLRPCVSLVHTNNFSCLKASMINLWTFRLFLRKKCQIHTRK